MVIRQRLIAMSFIPYYKVASASKSNLITSYVAYDSNESLECRIDVPNIQVKRRKWTTTTNISSNLCNW